MVRRVRETKKRSRGSGSVASGALSTSRVADERGNGRPDGCGGVRRSMVGARGEGVEVGPHSCTLQKVICYFLSFEMCHYSRHCLSLTLNLIYNAMHSSIP